MKKRVLFALDLEGVNKVVGEPYMGLIPGSVHLEIACLQAAKEVNAAARALFDAGVQTVALWDNHNGGGNLSPNDLDERITLLNPDLSKPRMYFAEGNFDCICFFGYHAMEGTLGGVLAHTMNSTTVQYYKLNGRYIGEVDMDAYLAASHGISSVFFCGGNIACRQAKNVLHHLVTVTTKTELGRNKAEFRDNEELLAKIGKAVTKAVQTDAPVNPLTFPCTMDKSFKRVEDAEKYLNKVRGYGVEADYAPDEVMGYDGHTVRCKPVDIVQFARCI